MSLKLYEQNYFNSLKKTSLKLKKKLFYVFKNSHMNLKIKIASRGIIYLLHDYMKKKGKMHNYSSNFLNKRKIFISFLFEYLFETFFI